MEHGQLKIKYCLMPTSISKASQSLSLPWAQRTSGVTANLFNVGFVNNILFVSGGAGTLLKSTDDGATWVAKTSGITTEIHSCAYSPTLNIYVMGAQSSVFLYSTDDGETWSSVSLGINSCTILKILWIESLNIFVACASGGYVFTSTTGKIWSNVYLNAPVHLCTVCVLMKTQIALSL